MGKLQSNDMGYVLLSRGCDRPTVPPASTSVVDMLLYSKMLVPAHGVNSEADFGRQSSFQQVSVVHIAMIVH